MGNDSQGRDCDLSFSNGVPSDPTASSGPSRRTGISARQSSPSASGCRPSAVRKGSDETRDSSSCKRCFCFSPELVSA